MAASIPVAAGLSRFQRGKRWGRSGWLGFLFILQRDGLPVAVLHVVEQRCAGVCQGLEGEEEKGSKDKECTNTRQCDSVERDSNYLGV